MPTVNNAKLWPTAGASTNNNIPNVFATNGDALGLKPHRPPTASPEAYGMIAFALFKGFISEMSIKIAPLSHQRKIFRR